MPIPAQRAELVVVGGQSGLDFAELRAAAGAIAVGAQPFTAGRERPAVSIVRTVEMIDPDHGAEASSVGQLRVRWAGAGGLA